MYQGLYSGRAYSPKYSRSRISIDSGPTDTGRSPRNPKGGGVDFYTIQPDPETAGNDDRQADSIVEHHWKLGMVVNWVAGRQITAVQCLELDELRRNLTNECPLKKERKKKIMTLQCGFGGNRSSQGFLDSLDG